MEDILAIVGIALCWFLASRAILPVQSVRLQLGALLAADTTTLAPASANLIATIVAPFTPSETLVIGDLTLGSTNGLVPIACAAGAQEVAIDPVSQAQIITMLAGAAPGFRWVTSGSFAGPITVYGFALVTAGSAALLGTQALAAPVTFTEAGYQLDVDPAQMVLVLQPIT
jgi:hypothetical protein